MRHTVPEVVSSRSMPGPAGLPVVGNLFAIDRDPLSFLTEIARDHGDIARFRVAGPPFVLLSHPSLVHELLVTHREKTLKDRVTRGLDAVLGSGLLTSEGDLWRRQRRTISPSFQPRHLAGYATAMVRSTHERLPEVGVRDVHHDMTRITLDIVVRTVFGTEPGGEADEVGRILDDLMASFETNQRTFWRVVPEWVPGPHRTVVKERTARLDTIVAGLVARARACGGESLLHRLLEARDEQGPMSEQQLRDELVTLFLAGHETTAGALSFTLWLLAEHPEVQDRVREELGRVLGDRDPGPADLRALPALDAVLRESLRLYPPAWALGREVVEPFTLGGYTFEPGLQVGVAPWVLHRDPRFWVGADRFRPERWSRGEVGDAAKAAWMPFGGGPRVCVGQHFAMMEAGLVLATLLRRRRFHSVPGFVPELVAAVTLRTRHGLTLDVEALGAAG